MQILSKKPTSSVNNHPETVQKDSIPTNDIAPSTYQALVDELMNVNDGTHQISPKVNIDGEIRLHYGFNSGSKQLGQDSSGVRVRLGFVYGA